MSLTLGEKLREAREERGITLSEVAEQTRISSQYLECIEHDDYRSLPGGIFNKGFVKSFAKYVGVDEQEALADYSRLIADTPTAEEPSLKLYKPEVLTDERTGASMVPTVIVAVVILGLMTGGILFLINYLRQPAEPIANKTAPANANQAAPPANTGTAPDSPDMATLTVEVKAANKVTVMATVDAEPVKKTDIAAGSSVTLNPKESLTLSYLRWNASSVQLAINGKSITLPAAPLDPKDRDRIVFTINKDTLAQIWTSGSISGEAAPAGDANANVAAPPPTQPRPTPLTPKPANTAANAAPDAKPANKPPTMMTSNKPPTMMTSKPKPTP